MNWAQQLLCLVSGDASSLNTTSLGTLNLFSTSNTESEPFAFCHWARHYFYGGQRSLSAYVGTDADLYVLVLRMLWC